jgi:hypothetical protein
VGVAPFVLAAGISVPLVGDADPAGEGDLLIDDHDLAMRAMVDLRGTEPPKGPEPAQLDSVPLHEVKVGVIDRAGAERIEKEADPDTITCPIG